MASPLKYARLYEEGSITAVEAIQHILANLEAENIRDFFKMCPRVCLNMVREMTGNFPANADEVGWDQFILGRAVNYDGRLSAAEIDRIEDDFKNRFRNGAELFRQVDLASAEPAAPPDRGGD